ncbi:MAG: peptide deformylase [Candidatus Saelkia tenebricola]|nr:peptide deformylase [Candidatus Saelkia tenebricola]
MKILEIRILPDPVLRMNSSFVDEITSSEVDLLKIMVYTMKVNNGIGLAAPQIGVTKRMIVLKNEKGRILKLINPEIVSSEGVGVMREGCLSVPGHEVEFERPYEIVVVGKNEKNKETQIKAKGLTARVLQHEIDHLSGKLIIDYRR